MRIFGNIRIFQIIYQKPHIIKLFKFTIRQLHLMTPKTFYNIDTQQVSANAIRKQKLDKILNLIKTEPVVAPSSSPLPNVASETPFVTPSNATPPLSCQPPVVKSEVILPVDISTTTTTTTNTDDSDRWQCHKHSQLCFTTFCPFSVF